MINTRNVLAVTMATAYNSAARRYSFSIVARQKEVLKRIKYWNYQLNLYFLSFEISVNILRNQKYMLGLNSYSRQVSNYLDPILIYISL